MSRVVWPVDQNTEDSEVAPTESCSRRAASKDSSS
jgi:hypothetical protein